MDLLRDLVAAVVLLVTTLVTALVGALGSVEVPSVTTPGLVLVGNVVTMDGSSTVVPDGRVLVRDGKVAAIWSGEVPPEGVDVTGAQVVDAGPGALIFPGLINLHDHLGFDVLPLVPSPSSHVQLLSGRPFGTEPYANRYQWNTDPVAPEFDRLVRRPDAALTNAGLYTETVKYAEVQSILGGETTVQGSAQDPGADGVLARNLDHGAFGRDRIEARVASVMAPGFTQEADGIRSRMQAGLIDAWLVHLAEGVRDGDRRLGDLVSSRAELSRISSLGLLNDATVVVHGVGLEPSDFVTMRSAPPANVSSLGDGRGAKLVWSPLSNLFLYGKTTSVVDALAAGVTVTLGTDWSPSGSRNLLGELKVADRVLHHPDHPAGDPAAIGLVGEELDRALVAMVTRNAAQALRWDPEVGSIAPGKVADLIVVTPPATSPTPGSVPSPYRSLIDATERDVQLVLVGGVPRAGSPELMELLKPGDHELVQDHDGEVTKAVDVTDPAVPEGTQTLAQLAATLDQALDALGSQPGHESITLTPLLTEDDVFWFDVLGAIPPTAWPFTPYPANASHVLAGGNPFAPAGFRDQWWPGAG